MNHYVGGRRNRRQFCHGVARVGLAVVSLGLLAGCGIQPPLAQPAKVPGVGFLSLSSSPWHEAFREGLRELGYVEGQAIAIERRDADGRDELLAELAAELVRLNVDVIVAGGPGGTRAGRGATGTIPIIMVAGTADPVAAGWVASLARPGGNLTGLTVAPTDVVNGKRLELLKESIPGASRVAVLFDAKLGLARALEDAARALSLRLLPLAVAGPDDFEPAFEAATREAADVLFVAETPLLSLHRTRIADLAAKKRLPASAMFREFAEAGVLMTYGTSLSDLHRRAATYVDKILKGARPADLPVQQPTKFDFVVNLKTAGALGLIIPQSVLLQATEVIQ